MSVTKISELTGQALLERYRVGDYFLSSPKQTVWGSGRFARINAKVSHVGQVSLSEEVQSTLRRAREEGQSRPVAMGAVPFDRNKKTHIVVPEEVKVTGRIDWRGNEEQETPQAAYTIEQVPRPEVYMSGVEQGLDRIAAGELEKIVLARSLHMTSDHPVHVQQILTKLARHNTEGYTFAMDLPNEETAGPRTLIGASPELLVSKSGWVVTANPLAGSRPRSHDPVEDQRRADELLQSKKDLREHAVVVEAVKESLEPLCIELDVPDQPSLVKTETMWHLSTEVKGIVREDNPSSLELAMALHPTPAVCGRPTTAAHQAIQEIEPFDRQFFTGMVGWCDEHGDGEWIVTIRSAEVQEQSIRLYAGAGVVDGSKPEEELAETGAKLQTMLNAMGIEKEVEGL